MCHWKRCFAKLMVEYLEISDPANSDISEPLDELADLVSNLFTPIQNRGQDPLPMINDHPFGPNETSVCNIHILTSLFIISISFNSDLSLYKQLCRSTLSKYLFLLITNLHTGVISLGTSLHTSWDTKVLVRYTRI
jgi:hypothetical protein